MSIAKDETLIQLAEVARRGPNWDGFGSAASQPHSVRRARVFWLELLTASGRVSAPAVTSASDGSVAFVWSNSVEIHFPPEGAIFSIRGDGDNVRVADLRDIVEAADMVPKIDLA